MNDVKFYLIPDPMYIKIMYVGEDGGERIARIHGLRDGSPYIKETRFNPVTKKNYEVKRKFYGNALEAILKFAVENDYV